MLLSTKSVILPSRSEAASVGFSRVQALFSFEEVYPYAEKERPSNTEVLDISLLLIQVGTVCPHFVTEGTQRCVCVHGCFEESHGT